MSPSASSGPMPIHFVIGTGRCGSSLLHELICRHRDVRFMSNLDDRLKLPATVLSWSGTLHRVLPPAASRKGRARFAPSEGYRALAREIGVVLTEPGRDLLAADATPWLSKRTAEFFGRRGGAGSAGAMVHKWTGWPRAGFLHEVFPRARFVHVVRDGRAVVNSWLQMRWWRGYNGPDHWQWGPLTEAEQQSWESRDRSFPVLAAILWNRLIEAAVRASAAIPPDRWMDLRYEDLVTNPPSTMKQVLEFLELDATCDIGVERYCFDDRRSSAYRNDLPARDVDEITQVMFPHLHRFGYVVADRTASR